MPRKSHAHAVEVGVRERHQLAAGNLELCKGRDVMLEVGVELLVEAPKEDADVLDAPVDNGV